MGEDKANHVTDRPAAPTNPQDRFERTRARIAACAVEMGFEIDDQNLTTFTLVLMGMASDTKAAAIEKLGLKKQQAT